MPMDIRFTFTVANLCSSTKCNKNQSVPLQPELKDITSDKLSVKYVCQQNCNMTKAFYRATYNVQNHRTYHIAQIKVTFTFKDGNQLNRTCIGPGELPSCTLPQQKKTDPDIIGCTCKVESKNCTPPTTTLTNGTTTSDTITSTTTTISSEPTIAASSGPASDTAASTKTTDTTASGTQTDTPTPGPASGKTTSDTLTDKQDGSQIGVLVGGVVGGLFGGVIITVVIVFLCRACRLRRRHTEDEDGAGTKESHTYLGLIHTTSSSGKSPRGKNEVTSQVPDLIKVSAVQQASSAPSDVYDVIKEGEDNQLEVDPSACDQGDYTDITDDMIGAAVYSQEKDDPTDGDYNKLVRDGATETGSDVQGTYNRLGRGGATETGTDVQGTYNRLGREGATETGTDVQGTYNRLGREGATETTTDVQGTYNRLVREGATETTTDVQGTYNKLGSMVDDSEDNEPAGNNGTAADYFALEKPEDTYNKLEGKRSAEEEQEPYTKLGKATPEGVRTP
ncbi:uncharacterized protein LOC124127279 isoform X2 [Haliotis rufescens]|uniref:uncharacterized protein LOC124127279 isoform X2 n=1 Tax=Haliotis rufescens TaxID=6454 RepID=UPI00201F0180|nr:uncharacterized protein LOC124127279 isoform X2 [Haliotis rufescens]